jgi:hypothetical protein
VVGAQPASPWAPIRCNPVAERMKMPFLLGERNPDKSKSPSTKGHPALQDAQPAHFIGGSGLRDRKKPHRKLLWGLRLMSERSAQYGQLRHDLHS